MDRLPFSCSCTFFFAAGADGAHVHGPGQPGPGEPQATLMLTAIASLLMLGTGFAMLGSRRFVRLGLG